MPVIPNEVRNLKISQSRCSIEMTTLLRWFRLRRELSRTAYSLNRNILVQSRTIEPAKRSVERLRKS